MALVAGAVYELSISEVNVMLLNLVGPGPGFLNMSVSVFLTANVKPQSGLRIGLLSLSLYKILPTVRFGLTV